MTYAPECLKTLRNYAITDLGADPAGVGIVGDPKHGGGYHLGADRLQPGDYSAELRRDKAALKGATADAATALDLTTGSTDHRKWLAALLADLKAGADYTTGIRAINGTLDGKTAWRWDRQNDFKPTRTDDSHLVHTHIEWYRDVIAVLERMGNAEALLPVLTRPLEEDLGMSAEQKLDRLIVLTEQLLELLTFGTRDGKAATKPDDELGSAYIAAILRLPQQIASRAAKTNDLLTLVLKSLPGGKPPADKT